MADRAVIYARQSITREGSESLAEQVRQCRSAAKRLRLKVIEEVVEEPSTSGYAARGRKRKGFQRLLRLIAEHAADCVLVYKTDRLSRGGGPGWAPLLDAFEVVGRDLDRAVATPAGWLSEFEIGIRATMDREESKKTSDRMLAVRAQEAREGKPRITGQRAFGYPADWSKINRAEAKLIREAVKRVLAGESVYGVVSDWNARGLPSTKGGQWSVGVLHNLLVSGHIAALREHRGEVVGPGKWPAIIDVETHERLKAVLAPKRRWAKANPRRYPLVGLLRCGRCGAPLRSLAGGSGRARSYSCRKVAGRGGCNGCRIAAEPVEDFIRRFVCAQLADPETRRVLLAVAPDAPGGGEPSLAEAIRAVEERRERLVDLYMEGQLDKAGFLRRSDCLNVELDGLERALVEGSERTALVGLPRTFDELSAAWDERGVDFQRLLVSAVVGPITVGPGTPGRHSPVLERLQLAPRA